MTCNHDVSTPLRHLKVLLEINLSFALLLCALFLAAKFNEFLTGWNFYWNLAWAPQHGGQWCRFATTLAKRGACLISSAPWLEQPPSLSCETLGSRWSGKKFCLVRCWVVGTDTKFAWGNFGHLSWFLRKFTPQSTLQTKIWLQFCLQEGALVTWFCFLSHLCI